MQIFTINKRYSVVCRSESTRSGFRHLATLMVNGGDTDITAKCTYLNRTWERYQFESVLQKLLENTKKHGWMDNKDLTDFENMIKERGY